MSTKIADTMTYDDDAREQFAREALDYHIADTEVKKWIRENPDATAEEVIGDDWVGADPGPFEDIDALKAAMIRMLEVDRADSDSDDDEDDE